MTAAAFVWPIRVYWEDTDGGGVVYHANYLRFLERARTEWLRQHGIEQGQVRAAHDIVFVVRDLKIDFLKPARLDDELDVTVTLLERRAATLVFAQQLLRRGDRTLLATARVRAACIEASSFRPRPIPNDLLAEIPNA